jgi:uncharacterized caspase-like protein
MSRLTIRVCAAVCLVVTWLNAGSAAAADKRVALVIGNLAYASLEPLATPGNDAKLISKTLREIGFTEVLERHDLTLASMVAALGEFAARAEGADWALIYFAGHGLEVKDTSYVVPTDAKLAQLGELAGEAVTLDRLFETPVHVAKLRVVILDISRNNPFAGDVRPSGFSGGGKTPAVGDVFLAFATGPSKTLPKPAGENGALALALARHLPAAGVDIRQVFQLVGDDVRNSTNMRQIPFTHAALSGPHSFVPAAR